MDTVELRALPFELQLQRTAGDGEGDGRTLVGRLVPYGVSSDVSDGGPRYRERFTRGAFSRQIESGQHRQVALFAEHNLPGLTRRLPLARADALYDEGDGLYGSFPMPHTTAADDALELVRSGIVTGLSLGFVLLGERSRRGRDGVVERTRAHVDHVALTHAPAYAGAEVVGLRDLGGAGAAAELQPGRPLGAWRRDLERLRSALD